MIYLSKILPLFLLPVGVVFLLLLAAFLFRRWSLVVVAGVVLYISSIPLTGRMGLAAIESGMVRGHGSEAPSADAIVTLSGGRSVAPGDAKISEWSDADRFFGGLELFEADRAPRLVFTGGWAPWEPDAPTEGEILVGFAKKFGVPGDAVTTTGKVLNTAEEAEAVAVLLEDFHLPGDRKPEILLVTSAFHMPRAQREFEKMGMVVHPFPVDFYLPQGRKITLLDFIPSAGGLSQTTLCLRELYGRLFARIF